MKPLTICEELVRQGYLSKVDFAKEVAYCHRTVPNYIRNTYYCIIWPVVLLMRMLPIITPLVAIIAYCVWIFNALYQEDLYRSASGDSDV